MYFLVVWPSPVAEIHSESSLPITPSKTAMYIYYWQKNMMTVVTKVIYFYDLALQKLTDTLDMKY